MAESFIRLRPVTPGQRHDGDSQAAERHRRGVGDQGQRNRLARREAQAEQQKSRHGHGRAKAGRAFQQSAETERHQDGLNARVAGGVFAHPSAQQIKIADIDRKIVEPQRGKDDPEDWPDGIGKPVQPAQSRQMQRHAPHKNGQEERRRQAQCGGKCSAFAQPAHHDQDYGQRQRGEESGNSQIVRRAPAAEATQTPVRQSDE